MLNLKKTALAVIALGSTAAFAGTMGPVCSAVNVTVPCENTAWDIGGRALYMQATGGFSGDVTYVRNTSFSQAANPNWGWGFQLEGSYHYSTGNDFNLNWYHFRTGGVNNVLDAATTVEYNAGHSTVSNTFQPTNTFVSNTPAWDQVNMEFGQHVDFGENKFARFHAGMNFSRVAFNGSSELYYITSTDSLKQADLYSRSTVYNGFGPRAGMDLNYEWGNGLGVYGTGAVSVLAGSSKFSDTRTAYYTSAGVANADPVGLVTSGSQHRVIGELDGKLGAMYTYAMAQGDLSLDIGWAFAQYIGALRTADTGVDGATIVSDKTSNFGIQGLYFGMKWIGNVA